MFRHLHPWYKTQCPFSFIPLTKFDFSLVSSVIKAHKHQDNFIQYNPQHIFDFFSSQQNDPFMILIQWSSLDNYVLSLIRMNQYLLLDNAHLKP